MRTFNTAKRPSLELVVPSGTPTFGSSGSRNTNASLTLNKWIWSSSRSMRSDPDRWFLCWFAYGDQDAGSPAVSNFTYAGKNMTSLVASNGPTLGISLWVCRADEEFDSAASTNTVSLTISPYACIALSGFYVSGIKNINQFECFQATPESGNSVSVKTFTGLITPPGGITFAGLITSAAAGTTTYSGNTDNFTGINTTSATNAFGFRASYRNNSGNINSDTSNMSINWTNTANFRSIYYTITPYRVSAV